MSANIASLFYLVSGVLFIMALRGLSSPATSRQGNLYGMIGMGVAMVTTLILSPPSGGGRRGRGAPGGRVSARRAGHYCGRGIAACLMIATRMLDCWPPDVRA
jgi:hypothetical protein